MVDILKNVVLITHILRNVYAVLFKLSVVQAENLSLGRQGVWWGWGGGIVGI